MLIHSSTWKHSLTRSRRLPRRKLGLTENLLELINLLLGCAQKLHWTRARALVPRPEDYIADQGLHSFVAADASLDHPALPQPTPKFSHGSRPRNKEVPIL